MRLVGTNHCHYLKANPYDDQRLQGNVNDHLSVHYDPVFDSC